MASVPVSASPFLPRPVAPARAGGTTSRHGGIDVLRIVAVVGVVVYHAGLLAQLPALVGMHALIAAAVFFAAHSRVGGSAGRIVARRASRLLLPWLLFALLHLACAVRSGSVRPWMWVIGGSMHLWFVPFIFVVTCGVALVCRKRPWPRAWALAAGWAVLALATIHLEARLTPTVVDRIPVWQCLDGATAVLAAFAVLSVPTTAGRWAPAGVALFLAAASVPLWVPWRAGVMMPVSPAGLGALLFLLVAALPARSNAVTDFVGRASFGLYLLHPLVLHVIDLGAARLRHEPFPRLDPATLGACAGLTIIASLAAVAGLERTPLRRVVG